MPLTKTTALQMIRALRSNDHDFRISARSIPETGEIRITLAQIDWPRLGYDAARAEAVSYYATDPQDAVDTATAMLDDLDSEHDARFGEIAR